MATLADILGPLPGDSLALVTPQRRATRRQLLDAAMRLRQDAKAPADLVVSGGDTAAAIARMVALDGYASAMYFIPQDARDALLPKIEELASKSPPLEPGAATRWIMATSGTTGTPKLVAHTLASLTRSLKKDAGVGAQLHWALLYDPCRFAGLQVVLQALIGGSVLLAAPADDIEGCVNFLQREQCTSVSATPSMWRKLLLAEATPKLDLRHITLGGEVADGKTLERLRGIFPAARITHIYASTEGGVGFSVRDAKAGFPVSYLDAVPGGKIELKIDSRGILLIKGHGFQQHYVDHAQELLGGDGFIDTGDLVEVRGDRVMFLGRANGSINVGGQKVMPEEVETVLRNCPEVIDVRVYGKPSPILGAIVAADVVTRNKGEDAQIKRQLTRLCKNELEAFKRPAIIKIIGDIALTGAGKVKRGP